MENQHSGNQEELPIPRTQIMHAMIMFAAANVERFTRFVNSHLEDDEKRMTVKDVSYMVGMVHGSYDTIQVVEEREKSLIADVIRTVTIPSGKLEENSANSQTGLYL